MNLDKLVNDWRANLKKPVRIEHPVTEQLCAVMDERELGAVRLVDAVIEVLGPERALELFYEADEALRERKPEAFCIREPGQLRTTGGLFIRLANAEPAARIAMNRVRATMRRELRAAQAKWKAKGASAGH